MTTVVQGQTAVTAYLKSKQLLLFVFAEDMPFSMAEDNPATAISYVSAIFVHEQFYFSS